MNSCVSKQRQSFIRSSNHCKVTTWSDVATQPLTRSSTFWCNRTFGVQLYNVLYGAVTLQRIFGTVMSQPLPSSNLDG